MSFEVGSIKTEICPQNFACVIVNVQQIWEHCNKFPKLPSSSLFGSRISCSAKKLPARVSSIRQLMKHRASIISKIFGTFVFDSSAMAGKNRVGASWSVLTLVQQFVATNFHFFCLGLNFILSSVSSVGLIITAQQCELGSFKLDFGLPLSLAQNLLLDSSQCPFCLCTPLVSRTRTLCFMELVVWSSTLQLQAGIATDSA